MDCRPGCAACCIAVSISSALPGMPHGKPAGIRCVNLDNSNNCTVHNSPEYPAICRNLKAEEEMCGDNRNHAMAYLANLERLTGS